MGELSPKEYGGVPHGPFYEGESIEDGPVEEAESMTIDDGPYGRKKALLRLTRLKPCACYCDRGGFPRDTSAISAVPPHLAGGITESRKARMFRLHRPDGPKI